MNATNVFKSAVINLAGVIRVSLMINHTLNIRPDKKFLLSLFELIVILIFCVGCRYETAKIYSYMPLVGQKYKPQVVREAEGKQLPAAIPIPEGGRDINVITGKRYGTPKDFFVSFNTYENGILVMKFYDGVFWKRMGTKMNTLMYSGPDTKYEDKPLTKKLEKEIESHSYTGKPVRTEYHEEFILGKYLSIYIGSSRLLPKDYYYNKYAPWHVVIIVGPSYAPIGPFHKKN